MRKELKSLEARGGSGLVSTAPVPGLLSWPPPSPPWLFTQYVLLGTCVKHLLMAVAKGQELSETLYPVWELFQMKSVTLPCIKTGVFKGEKGRRRGPIRTGASGKWCGAQ